MCSPGWGNLVAFDRNDLPVSREVEGKFLKNVKCPPHALPPPRRLTLIGALSKARGFSIGFIGTYRYIFIHDFVLLLAHSCIVWQI